jgi:hypothetical protein
MQKINKTSFLTFQYTIQIAIFFVLALTYLYLPYGLSLIALILAFVNVFTASDLVPFVFLASGLAMQFAGTHSFAWLIATFALLANKHKNEPTVSITQSYLHSDLKALRNMPFDSKPRKRRLAVKRKTSLDEDFPVYALEDYPVFL